MLSFLLASDTYFGLHSQHLQECFNQTRSHIPVSRRRRGVSFRYLTDKHLWRLILSLLDLCQEFIRPHTTSVQSGL